MDQLNVFAQQLRQLLTSRGLSQTAVADGAGIPQTTISRWVNGEAEPGLSGLIRLARYFELSIDAMCGIASPPDKLQPGNWLLDVDALDECRAGKNTHPELWAIAIPDRYRIVSSAEYQRLRNEVHRGKR